MSNITNEKIAEAKYEMFGIACSDGDYLTAKAIIADTKQQGFETEAAIMEAEMLAMPAGSFKTKLVVNHN